MLKFVDFTRQIYNAEYSILTGSLNVFIELMKEYQQRMKSEVDILSWVDKNMYGPI